MHRIGTPGALSPEATTPYPRGRNSRFISKSDLFTLFSPSSENEMKVSVALKYGDWTQEFVSAMTKRNWSDSLTALTYLNCADKRIPNGLLSSNSALAEAISQVINLDSGENVYEFLKHALNELKKDNRTGSSAIKQSAIKTRNSRKKAFLSLLQQIAISQCSYGFAENFESNKIIFLSRFAEWKMLTAESVYAITSHMDELENIINSNQEERSKINCSEHIIAQTKKHPPATIAPDSVRSPLSPISGNVQHSNSAQIKNRYMRQQRVSILFIVVNLAITLHT